jgi:hypothetical protein
LAFDVSSFVTARRSGVGRCVDDERSDERDFHLSTLDGRTPLDGTQGIAFSTTGTVYVTH